ncbi:hypothetical protein L596_018901 [Steinernema carpocapsae]|uniref:Uncharacterized protein n=1 Tax=Steinernema carpocapsae TaxID=34508 RepID=A0A4U5N609_STECR|nr:hypothetical protein L596_018901 [Steinernema carpocapsae]
MGNEAVNNGRGTMPGLPSPLDQLQAEYARRLAEESPNFRPLETRRRKEGSDLRSRDGLHPMKSVYLFEGTIGKSTIEDLATALEMSDAEGVGRVPSLTDSSVFGFSDVVTSASQVSVYLPSQCPSEYSNSNPANIFTWNREKSKKTNKDAQLVNESVYCMNELNESRSYEATNHD